MEQFTNIINRITATSLNGKPFECRGPHNAGIKLAGNH